MGASYSTEIPGATERQKERYGVFSLRTKQKQSLVVVEDLIDELMNSKNINSLMSLFTPGSDTIKCTDMFIVLSSTLKKEFQLFKFPDPVRPSDISDVAYLPRTVYDAKYKDDPSRNKLCENIAWFMVRFTTLIFALAASLKVPQTLSFIDGSKPLFVPTIVDGKKLEFDLGLIDGYDNIDYMPNIMFINNSSVLIDTNTSVVFTQGEKTAYGIIEIVETQQNSLLSSYEKELKDLENSAPPARAYGFGYDRIIQLRTKIVEEKTKQMEKKYLVTIYKCDEKGCKLKATFEQPAIPNAAPMAIAAVPMAIAAAPMAAPGAALPMAAPGAPGAAVPMAAAAAQDVPIPIAPRSNASTDGSVLSMIAGSTGSSQNGGGRRRKTRKTSYTNRRKTYKLRGGGVWNANSTKGLPAGAVQFILYKNGMTSSLNAMDTTRTPFNERVKQILENFNYKISADQNPYIPLGNIKSSVVTRLLTISNILKKQVNSNEGTSPAQYRAYILATQTKEQGAQSGKALTTSFCKDIWANKQVTRVLPYALLDALFKDEFDDVISSATKLEYKMIVNQFVVNNMMKPNESGSKETFSDVTFTSAHEILTALCSRSEYSITNPLFIETLMEGHKALRDLYDIHIQAVIQFITSKLITPKFRGYKEQPQWTMNPIFANDPRGALATLESIIKEARIMLVKHYFAVESVYVKTLEKMKEMGSGLGEVPSNPLTAAAKKNEINSSSTIVTQ